MRNDFKMIVFNQTIDNFYKDTKSQQNQSFM